MLSKGGGRCQTTPSGKPIKVSGRKSHFSRDQITSGSWHKKEGRAGNPQRDSGCKGLEGRQCCPKHPDSSLSNAISNPQEVLWALPSKYIQVVATFPHSLPGAHKGYMARHTHTHPQTGVHGTKSYRILQACQGLWTKHRGKSKAFWRTGRRLPEKRGKEWYSWQREQHMQRPREMERPSV